ncbi:sulfotransferase [Thalassococcus sp. CAU 1522]|uniref:Sulfotransferase n=1 Tax=Thalassococcus arenae TaxID=2851652 RepID=A0ABS6N3G9_9RHOB|nr:sulfotransferase [Thalassococcus arenae]MBV2358559.1 sulfotransferase [Thalassococcus arenae]
MDAKLHFISGLPRSGSTLLAGILRQNPRFHAAMTGPVGALFGSMYNTMGATNETAVFLDEEMRKALLTGLFSTYYARQTDCEVIFDTNRVWCSRVPSISALFPRSKVICCVRDVGWIMDSIECLVRKNAFEPSKLFATTEERATVFSRVEALAHRDRLVGFSWSALKEAYYGPQSDRLLLVEYDILCQRPEEVLRLIYEFIEEPYFEHDFDNVEYSEENFDAQLATRGLHDVRRKVEHRPRATILPPDLFARYDNHGFWRDPKGSSAYRIVSKPPAAAAA